MTITTDVTPTDRAGVTAPHRPYPLITRRPRIAALLCYLANAAVIVGGAVLARTLAPSWSGMAQSLLASVGVAALAVALLTGLRWWRTAGFNGRAEWRDLRLLALPAALTVVPVLTGFRPVAAGLLAMLITGYALTGFMEEALWRGVVLRILRPTGTLPSVLLGSALFGAAHLTNVLFRPSVALVVAQAVGAACFGVGYAALRLRTNTIWPLMLLHLMTDLFAAVGALPAIPILVAQDIILLAYGLWLLRRRTPSGQR
ncbi:CPBP family intramembrane metalloprotease [Planosporangium thailandense]|uniref:CPBP family intramembrane metalloprotease n=1 Tax=Planosporangium thailandense TaxID=765197 RepID=A0ABX0XVB3_9ACTN|nr:CPBP family intramembrane glutamic endopeptidase [Planosporangium thailandense]NJC69139.1 CPBP family intramembrane metalloprotease [Planosporangium thailandense]